MRATRISFHLVSLTLLPQVGPETVVLDVCCGTGTIGLCMAKVAKRVIGIEMNPQAVQDARCGVWVWEDEWAGGGGREGG
jgi:methylase of polypeptide subunit release factors